LHGQKFCPCLCHKDRNCSHINQTWFEFVKLSSSTSVIIATTQSLATYFKGVIPHELFSWLDSKGKHKFGIPVHRSSCRSIKSRFKAAPLFTIFRLKSYTVLQLQLQLCYCAHKFTVYKCTRNAAKYCQTLHSSVANYVECYFNVFWTHHILHLI
jgi:hypothetical protein